MKYPSLEEILEANDKKQLSHEDMLVIEFIRQFSIETVKILTDKQSVTVFREMPLGTQVTCMVQGVMMALAAITMPNFEKDDEERIRETSEFLKINVDVGIENALIMMDNASNLLKKMGMKAPGKR